MRTRRLWSAAGRIFLSGALALIALTLFCFFYYNIPVHANSPDGATDYKWESHVFYSRATEGFAMGRTNNDGYLNRFDYDGGSVEVLLMGSSQTENFQVPMNCSIAAGLNALIGRNAVYNIGISAHGFLTCADNLEAALGKYQPKQVLMETSSLSFSEESLREALEATMKEIPSHAGGIVALLQRNPYLRLLYAQIQHYRGQGDEAGENGAPSGDIPATFTDERLLNELLAKIRSTANESGADVLVFYHPPIAIDADGTIQFPDNPEEERIFAACCESNGIAFLNLRERFRDEYERRAVLPYGFSNTEVGAGHFNRSGCKMAAEELYRMIGGES